MKRLLYLMLSLPLFTNAAEADSHHFKTILEIEKEAAEEARKIFPEIQSGRTSVQKFLEDQIRKTEEKIIAQDQKKRMVTPFPPSSELVVKNEKIDYSCNSIVFEFLKRKTVEYSAKLGITSPVKIFADTRDDSNFSVIADPYHLIFISNATLEKGPKYAFGVLLHELSHLTGTMEYLKANDNARRGFAHYNGILGAAGVDRLAKKVHFDETRADTLGALLGEREASAILYALKKDYQPSPEVKRKTPKHPSSNKRIRAVSVIAHLHELESSAANSPGLPDSGIASPFAKK